MRKKARLAWGLVLSVACVTGAYASAAVATTNYIPKYNSGGTLVDSAMVESGGNVGIGTATPLERFVVVGGIDSGIVLTDSAGNIRARMSPSGAQHGEFQLWNSSGTPTTYIGGAGTANFMTGKVGVNTSTITEQLTVRGTTNSGIRVENSSGQIRARLSPGGSQEGELELWNHLGSRTTYIGGAGVSNFVTGKFGIGLVTPTEALHVGGNAKIEGNVTATGNIAAKYQDIAEWVDAREAYAPGTVVIASERSATISSSAYDTTVIGVVSGQPGVLLGEAGAGRVAVAQSGRVRIKVDASKGSIRVGDLLVTSDTPGHAMRSMPLTVAGVSMHRPGTIIGKALESLPRGRGEILVLVTLQ